MKQFVILYVYCFINSTSLLSISNLLRLIFLAAIWGASFMFTKLTVPQLGPYSTASIRLLIGGIFMLIYFVITGFNPEVKKYYKEYFIIGVLNSGIPFTLFAYAAQHLPASLLAILNSTAPLFGAVFSAIWLSDKLNFQKILGLILGMCGVALTTNITSVNITNSEILSIGLCLVATMCYGLAGVYMKKKTSHINSTGITGIAQLFGGAFIFPTVFLSDKAFNFNLPVTINILCLAILCSAIAYLLYYKLVKDVGPTKALTVTFLIPVFGILLSVIFLGEHISLNMIGGIILILLGTSLVLNLVKLRSKKLHEAHDEKRLD
jgi:drug/metabolite transporter (DMT)-like permease